MNHSFESTRLIVVAALVLGSGCSQRRADTSTPEPAAQPRPQAAEASPTDATPRETESPDLSGCTVERVLQALEASDPWTDDEGKRCGEALAPRCEDGDGSACFASALIHFSGVGGAARDHDGAARRYAQACELGVSDACRDLAWFVRDGILGEGDAAARRDRALSLLTRACELGDDESCRNKDELRPHPAKAERAKADPPPLVVVDGANASSLQSEANGLVIEELRCAVSRPLMGIIAVSGALAERKPKLDRCAPSGAAFVVHFEFAKGKTNNVRAEGGTAAENRCVTKALTAAKAPVDSRCGAVVLVGEPEGARASLAAMRRSGKP